jgi:hypothetical protein
MKRRRGHERRGRSGAGCRVGHDSRASCPAAGGNSTPLAPCSRPGPSAAPPRRSGVDRGRDRRPAVLHRLRGHRPPVLRGTELRCTGRHRPVPAYPCRPPRTTGSPALRRPFPLPPRSGKQPVPVRPAPPPPAASRLPATDAGTPSTAHHRGRGNRTDPPSHDIEYDGSPVSPATATTGDPARNLRRSAGTRGSRPHRTAARIGPGARPGATTPPAAARLPALYEAAAPGMPGGSRRRARIRLPAARPQRRLRCRGARRGVPPPSPPLVAV